ncbi:MAG TPA: tetratricopeptide repeat protein [Thermoanaerobaculia bacterium]|nr:tetratricopeptide repeat protein [Thermoanaerobaculia bacterium]
MPDEIPIVLSGRASRRPAGLLAAILGLALVLRLAHWAAVRGAPFVAQLAMDSQEYDRWAREIAAGNWRGGEVFFQAPLYPYLLGLLYTLAGHSVDAVYLAQIGLAVAGCYALYRAGIELAGPAVGLAAAGLAAIYGPFLFYDVQLLKESLAVTTTCFLLWTLAAARVHAGGGRWWIAGSLLGILSLLRENALLLVPFLLPLAFWRTEAGAGRSERSTRASLRWAGALLGGLALILAPVALRNGLVGGSFLPTTFQGGVNFFIGNNAQADGSYRPIVPGKQIPALERREPVRLAEQALGRRLTPAEVSRYWLGRGMSWALGNPADFVRLSWRKLGMFWSWYEWPDAVDYYYLRALSPVYRLPLAEFGGVALLAAAGLFWLRPRSAGADLQREPAAQSPQLRQRVAAPVAAAAATSCRTAAAGRLAGRVTVGRFAPALLFALGWMLATVVFFLFARYRLPAVPALMLVAALPLAALAESWALWRRSSGAGRAAALRLGGLLALAAAALALPRLVPYGPRADLVQFNLARLAEERGHLAEAERGYRQALDANPRDFLAWLDLGNLAARRRDWTTALRDYSQAAVLEPRSDDAESNLLGVCLALGRLPEARRHLARALALNSRSFQALHNGSLLAMRLGDLAAARDLNRRALEVDPANPAARGLRDHLARLLPPPG